RLPLKGNGRGGRACNEDVGLLAGQLLRERSYPIDVIAVPTKIRPHVAGIGPTQVRKRLSERSDASLRHGIVFVGPHEHAAAPDAVALLRPRRVRPRRRASKPRDELPPSHSITSSASASSVSGTVRPSALAVFRLRINCTFVFGWTGRSLGSAPLRMRPA